MISSIFAGPSGPQHNYQRSSKQSMLWRMWYAARFICCDGAVLYRTSVIMCHIFEQCATSYPNFPDTKPFWYCSCGPNYPIWLQTRSLCYSTRPRICSTRAIWYQILTVCQPALFFWYCLDSFLVCGRIV